MTTPQTPQAPTSTPAPVKESVAARALRRAQAMDAQQAPAPTQAAPTPASAPAPAPAPTQAAPAQAAAPAPAPTQAAPASTQTVKDDAEEYDINPQKQAEPLLAEEEVDTITDPQPENFMKLRKNLKSTIKIKKTLETELEETKKRLVEYETGIAAPEQITKMQQRIQELEVFEQVHNFKGSPAYKENFIKPIEEQKAKFLEVSEDYNLPETFLDQAVNIENKAELNRFLSTHLDQVAALEVKSIVENIKKVRTKAVEAEKNPQVTMSHLEQQQRRLEEIREQQRAESIKNSSKNGWISSLMQLRETGEFPELKFVDGNSEHNEKVARPLIQKAASEYSKVVKMLSDHGIKQLPYEVSYALANMVQRAYVSSIAAAQRAQLVEELETTKKLIQTRQNIDRPGANGVGVMSAPSGYNQSQNPTDRRVSAARRALEKGNKR